MRLKKIPFLLGTLGNDDKVECKLPAKWSTGKFIQ